MDLEKKFYTLAGRWCTENTHAAAYTALSGCISLVMC